MSYRIKYLDNNNVYLLIYKDSNLFKKLLNLSLILSPFFSCSDPPKNTNTVQNTAPPMPMPGGEIVGGASGAGGSEGASGAEAPETTGGSVDREPAPPVVNQQNLIPYVPNTYLDFVAEYATLACEKIRPCCTLDNCEEVFSTSMLPMDVEALLASTEDVVFMADRAESCLEALRTFEGCEIDKLIESRCTSPAIIADFRGIGEPCSSFCDATGAECIEGVCVRGGLRHHEP